MTLKNDGGFMRDSVTGALVVTAVNTTSITSFGAAADGVTSDSTPLTNAVAALPTAGGAVYLPRGTYYLDSQFTVTRSNVHFYGDGPGTKILFATGLSAASAIRVNTSALNTGPPRLTDISFRNMTIDFQGSGQSWSAGLTGGLVAYAVDRFEVDHVKFLNGRDSCVSAYGCTDVQVTNCRVDTCYWQGASNPINISGTTGVESDNLIIRGNIVKHTTTLTVSSATASASVGTYTTSAAHKLAVGQDVKITGMLPAAYNTYGTVASVPSGTTFTVAIASTPVSSTQAGTVAVRADRNIYAGSINSYRTIIANNISEGARAAIDAEVGTPGGFDMMMTGNVVTDFSDRGMGVSNTSGDAAVYGHRAVIADNVVRGNDGTTDFGVAARGSLTGIVLTGENLRCSGNMISNVREGIRAGLAALEIEETNYAISDNTIVMAADANGDGINIAKNTATNYLRRLQIRGNQIDGQVGTTSLQGIYLNGHVIDFDVTDNTIRGMGRNGIYCATASAVAPSQGRIRGNDLIDNSTTTSNTYFGVRLDTACSDVRTAHNKAYDTRGTKLQSYGLRVEAGATSIVSLDDDWTGNLTGELSDATAQGIRIADYRDPDGFSLPWVSDPLEGTVTAVTGAGANGAVFMRVKGGAGRFSNVIVWAGPDSTTPGTTDKIGVAVLSNKGTGRTCKPGTLKAASSSTSGSGSIASPALQTIALGSTIQVNVGDWVCVWAASATTQFASNRDGFASASLNTGFSAFNTTNPWPVASDPTVTTGGNLKYPQVSFS